IAIKVYNPTGPGGPNDQGLGRKHISEAINGSLERLQTDYVDLYQAHRYDTTVPLEETMLTFADVVRAGKALYIGVSEWTADQIRDAAVLAYELRVPLISNQPQYNMMWRVIESRVVPTCQELGLGQIVFSPLAQGVLSGKYQPGQPPPRGSRASGRESGYFMGHYFERAGQLDAVQKLRPIAAELGLSMPALAVAWVLQNDNVGSAIIGASRPEQVRDNATASGVKLEAEVLRRIDDALEGFIERDPSKTG
ncbi:MAG: aldo/keto reductase, partial [Actinomycetota bacterium]|nr:aldo/keto reductase [Actinomycetota bacterium]